ncbi:MAG: ATP-binding protein, partial [Treponema sp.]|nr:ATP-binding protein [Treponema sp.]
KNIDNVYIAGGIGSGINIEKAISIGILPNISKERYHYIGNSSLAGAYAMLQSQKAAQKIDEIAGMMTYLELSSHSSYMDEFIAACFLPHTNSELFYA